MSGEEVQEKEEMSKEVEKKTGRGGKNTAFLLVAALIPVFFVAGLWAGSVFLGEQETTPVGEEENLITATLIIDYGDGNVTQFENVSTNATTVLDFLLYCSAKDMGNYTVEISYWPQYDSYLVESINGYRNGDGNRYWEYTVNGELPMVGADKYVLHDGDVVEWKFGEMTF